MAGSGDIPKIRYIAHFKSIYGSACQHACHPIWNGLTGTPKLGVQKAVVNGLGSQAVKQSVTSL